MKNVTQLDVLIETERLKLEMAACLRREVEASGVSEREIAKRAGIGVCRLRELMDGDEFSSGATLVEMVSIGLAIGVLWTFERKHGEEE